MNREERIARAELNNDKASEEKVALAENWLAGSSDKKHVMTLSEREILKRPKRKKKQTENERRTAAGYVPLDDAAKRLDLSVSEVRKLIASEALTCERGGSTVSIYDIEAYKKALNLEAWLGL